MSLIADHPLSRTFWLQVNFDNNQNEQWWLPQKGATDVRKGAASAVIRANTGAKDFKSFTSRENFKIKYHLTCATEFVIYCIHCHCCLQYVGRTNQKLRNRINRHRANVKKGFLLHNIASWTQRGIMSLCCNSNRPNPIWFTEQIWIS